MILGSLAQFARYSATVAAEYFGVGS